MNLTMWVQDLVKITVAYLKMKKSPVIRLKQSDVDRLPKMSYPRDLLKHNKKTKPRKSKKLKKAA